MSPEGRTAGVTLDGGGGGHGDMIEGVEAFEAAQRILSAVCQLVLGTPGRIVLHARRFLPPPLRTSDLKNQSAECDFGKNF